MKCDFPVPLGPQTTRTSARSTHSSVRSACWVGFGTAEASGSQASKVLPAGSPDARRRIVIVARQLLMATITWSTNVRVALQRRGAENQRTELPLRLVMQSMVHAPPSEARW